MRAMAGLSKYMALNKRLSFLTLTSSPDSDSSKFNAHFEVLRKRIERTADYFADCETYPRKYRIAIEKPFKMEYFKVRTSEGHGVFHCLAYMPYISQFCLKAAWDSIHRAYEVAVKGCYNWDRRVANYIISKYVAEQKHFISFSSSQNWVFKGFVAKFKFLVMKYGYIKGLLRWKRILQNPETYKRKKGFLQVDISLFLYTDSEAFASGQNV